MVVVSAVTLWHLLKEVTSHMWTNQLGVALRGAKTCMNGQLGDKGLFALMKY